MPTPNMSRTTPISASCGASLVSATNPVCERADSDPGKQVADKRRQPRRAAANPPTNAKAKPTAMIAIRRGVVSHSGSAPENAIDTVQFVILDSRDCHRMNSAAPDDQAVKATKATGGHASMIIDRRRPMPPKIMAHSTRNRTVCLSIVGISQ